MSFRIKALIVFIKHKHYKVGRGGPLNSLYTHENYEIEAFLTRNEAHQHRKLEIGISPKKSMVSGDSFKFTNSASSALLTCTNIL